MFDGLNDVLYEGETVLWQGKPDKFCYMWRSVGKLLPIAFIWLLFDGFFIATILSGDMDMPQGMPWFLIVFFALHLLPVWKVIGMFIKKSLEHKNVIYAVTDKRVIARNGVIGLDFDNITYMDIANVHVNVSALERMRKVGSLFVTTSSGAGLCLLSIPEPYAVYKRINKVFMDVKSDIHYPNALRPDVNPGYGTKYEG